MLASVPDVNQGPTHRQAPDGQRGPVLTDGVIVLNAYTNDDIPAHLAGEGEETANRFG
jgi:hypothetical protein